MLKISARLVDIFNKIIKWDNPSFIKEGYGLLGCRDPYPVNKY